MIQTKQLKLKLHYKKRIRRYFKFVYESKFKIVSFFLGVITAAKHKYNRNVMQI